MKLLCLTALFALLNVAFSLEEAEKTEFLGHGMGGVGVGGFGLGLGSGGFGYGSLGYGGLGYGGLGYGGLGYGGGGYGGLGYGGIAGTSANALRHIDNVGLANVGALNRNAAFARGANINRLNHVYYKKATVYNAKHHVKAAAKKAATASAKAKHTRAIGRKKSLALANARRVGGVGIGYRRHLAEEDAAANKEFYGYYGGYGHPYWGGYWW